MEYRAYFKAFSTRLLIKTATPFGLGEKSRLQRPQRLNMRQHILRVDILIFSFSCPTKLYCLSKSGA